MNNQQFFGIIDKSNAVHAVMINGEDSIIEGLKIIKKYCPKEPSISRATDEIIFSVDAEYISKKISNSDAERLCELGWFVDEIYLSLAHFVPSGHNLFD